MTTSPDSPGVREAPNDAGTVSGDVAETAVSEFLVPVAIAIIITIFLWLVSTYNFALYHTTVEFATIAISVAIFLLVWKSRKIIDNNYLLFIGFTFIFIAVLDFMHTLVYQGVGIFPDGGGTLSTRFWIAARYMQAITLLAAPLFIRRNLRIDIVAIVYLAADIIIVSSILIFHNFPATYIPGTGLTLFKIISEYIISLLLIGSILLLWRNRASFDRQVLNNLIIAIVLTIAAELTFTEYASFTDIFSLLGHVFRLVSYYFFYRAIIVVGQEKPYNLLYRNLTESEKKYRALSDLSPDAILVVQDGVIRYSNEAGSRMSGMPAPELIGKRLQDFVHPEDQEISAARITGVQNDQVVAPLRELKVVIGERTLEVEATAAPVLWEGMNAAQVVIRDISWRKKTEDELIRKNIDLNALNEELTATQEELQQNIDELSRAEGALRTALLRTTAILEGIAETFYSLDTQWRFTIVNPAAEKAPFGRPAAELLGKVIWDLYPGLVGTRIHQHYLDAAAKKTMEHYEALSPLNARWYEVFIQGRDEGVDVYMRDITDRKRAEEAVQESEGRLKFALETSHTGAWDLDLDDHTAFRSEEHDRIFGYPGLLTGWTYEMFLDRVLPADREVVDAKFRKAIETGSDWNFECRILRADGAIRWIWAAGRHRRDADGKQRRMAGIVQDITERKRAENALVLSEQRLRFALFAAQAGTWEWDLETNENVWSDETWQLYELEPGSGTPSFDLWLRSIHPDDREQAARAVNKAAQKGTDLQAEWRVNMADGTERWLMSRGKPVRGPGGSIVRYIGSVIDITERKRAEEERARLLAEVEKRAAYLDSTIASMTAGLIVYDTTGKAIRMNSVARTLFEPDLFFNLTVEERAKIIHWETEDGQPFPMDEIPALRAVRGATTDNVIIAAVYPDHKVWILVGASPIRTSDGELLGAVASFVDITLLKETEKALRESEERFRTLAADIPDMIVRCGRDMRILYANPAALRRTGRGEEAFIGRRAEEFGASPAAASRWEEAARQVFTSGEARRYEHSNKWHGEERVFDVQIVPELDMAGSVQSVLAIARDITERKHAEEALSETTQYLDNLFNYANAPIIVWDPAFRITRFNYAFEQLTGLNAGEAIGQPLSILFPEKYRAPSMEVIRRTMQGERLNVVEIPILRKDGGIRIVLWNSATLFNPEGTTFISTIAQGQDITERKVAEAENIRARQEWEQTFNTVPDLIALLDTNHRIIRVNKAMADHLGTTPGHCIGLPCHEAVHGTSVPPAFCPHVKTCADGKEHFAEVNEPGLGGTFTVSTTPLFNPDGTLLGTVHVAHDITDRIRAEAELRQRHEDLNAAYEKITATQEKLQQNLEELSSRESQLQDALAEKEILLSEIHHRVKNNLTAFISLLSLEGSYEDSESGKALKKDLQNRARSMALIHETLYKTRKFSNVEMETYLTPLVSQIAGSYAGQGTVRTVVEAPGVSLDLGRATTAGLIINEIVTNSFKYAFPPGFDCMAERGEACTIRVTLRREDGTVILTVADNGRGLPPGFDPLSSRSLGLKLVNFLAHHQLRAGVEVRSECGTAFIFRLENIEEE